MNSFTLWASALLELWGKTPLTLLRSCYPCNTHVCSVRWVSVLTPYLNISQIQSVCQCCVNHVDNRSSYRFLKFLPPHSVFLCLPERGWTVVSRGIEPRVTWPDPMALLIMWPRRLKRQRLQTTTVKASTATICGMRPVIDIISSGMWTQGYEGVCCAWGQICSHLWNCVRMWHACVLTLDLIKTVFLWC